jgi:DNA-binding CsgD family transcriptional regulator
VLLALREGDTASAEVEGRRAARLPGLSDFIRPPLFGYLAQALVWRGELEAAEWAIGESGCGPDLPEFVCLNPVFGSRGRLRLAQGRAEEALRDFEELGARSDRIGLLNPVQGWRLGAAAALVRLGRAGEAIPLAEEQLRLARRWGTSSAIGAAMHALALARGGRADELAEAERVLAEGPERLEHARCLVDLGASLRSDGRRRDAREPLRQALDIAWRCGAKPLAGRAYEELLAAGARPRRLTSSGADSLTPSERRVAGLAAEGRTNREIAQELFVTPKTVENQLGRVYGKLGVSSRKELAGALATTDDSTPRPAPVASPPQA